MSNFLTHRVKISPVIHALALESYSVGSDLTFLKQRGLAALPKTNSGTLSVPLIFAQTSVVILSFDCFPP